MISKSLVKKLALKLLLLMMYLNETILVYPVQFFHSSYLISDIIGNSFKSGQYYFAITIQSAINLLLNFAITLFFETFISI